MRIRHSRRIELITGTRHPPAPLAVPAVARDQFGLALAHEAHLGLLRMPMRHFVLRVHRRHADVR